MAKEEGKKNKMMLEVVNEIGQHVAVVVCNAAEWPEAIDAERAQKALERAQERMHDATATEEQRIYARHAIRRAKARLQIVKENEKKKDQFGL